MDQRRSGETDPLPMTLSRQLQLTPLWAKSWVAPCLPQTPTTTVVAKQSQTGTCAHNQTRAHKDYVRLPDQGSELAVAQCSSFVKHIEWIPAMYFISMLECYSMLFLMDLWAHSFFEKFETCEPCLLVYMHEETPCKWTVLTHLILITWDMQIIPHGQDD